MPVGRGRKALMGYFIFPMAVVLFFAGVAAQLGQMALAVPGSGEAGRMSAAATLAARQVEVFATACVNTALAAPGMVASNLIVTLPAGVNAPAGAVCMTTAAGVGRNVYGYAPGVGGLAGQIQADTHSSFTWLQVRSAGQAVTLATGATTSVPASIPVGAVVDWVQTSS